MTVMLNSSSDNLGRATTKFSAIITKELPRIPNSVAVVLPTEVWLHILSYLDECYLEPLLGVNKQLRGIGLDLCFRKAFAAPSWTRRPNHFNTIHYIDFHAGAPSVLHRVHELVFKDDPPVDQPGRLGMHFFPVWRGAIKQLANPKHHAMLRYFDQLLSQVDRMNNIRAITIHSNYVPGHWSGTPPELRHPYLKHKMKVFYALRVTHLSNITYLSLQTNLDILLPHWRKDIVFPNLLKLAVRVETNHPSDTSTQLLYPLVNNHRKTLVELVLTHSPFVEIKDVLDGINHLPMLRTFSLCWFIINSVSQRLAIWKFMAHHKAQLTDLRLRILPIRRNISPNDEPPIGDPKNVWNGLLDFNFPVLQHFSLLLKYTIYTPTEGTIHDFLCRHKTLLSLTIVPKDTSILPRSNFSWGVLNRFQREFRTSRPYPLLQDLSFFSASLDINLMSYFASSFPSLRYLRIYALTRLLSGTEEILRSGDLTELFGSWKLDDMVFEGSFRTIPVSQKRDVVNVFSGVTRFCGCLPWLWLLDDGHVAESTRLSPVVERLAPEYYADAVY